jgi:site-specific DNA-methyltransferase (adenine-specific)
MKNDHTPVLMFCNTRFGYDLIKSKEKWFRYDLVWNKMRGVSFLSANKMPMKSHEMVYVFSKKGANYYRKDIEGEFKAWKNNETKRYGAVYGDLTTMVRTTHGEGSEGKRCALSIIDIKGKAIKGQHPTEKPIDLYKWLIERYSKEGDMVLDPTFGSGNSGRASAELKRRYTGIEMNEKFFNSYNNETRIPAAIDKTGEEDDGGV